MKERKSKGEQQKRTTGILDAVTGSVAKITALVSTLSALALAVLVGPEKIYRAIVDIGLYSPPPCLEVNALSIPASVNFSEWHKMKIELTGRNNCAKQFGLFMTFVPRGAQPRFHIKIPHEHLPQCKGAAAYYDPACWDPKKPIRTVKGDWRWPVLPPPLELLGESNSVEILVTCAVFDYDAPTKGAIHHDHATITVHNDRSKPAAAATGG